MDFMLKLTLFAAFVAVILECLNYLFSVEIRNLKEEIKHERHNHKLQINQNLELLNENDMLRKQYNAMVQENLKIHRELNKKIIGIK